ncbi:hypothetical protein H6P81_003434 [Aristolochia fimbriata]|uniref:TTF-type domain-containing protein n=1 Tax=Aristolochia fimbriata TaxID=158543 RepID=A0AAV7FGD7_ARIFI|nr:hypothetical protein H6P81_003434 [Aristolochia fimbriata]
MSGRRRRDRSLPLDEPLVELGVPEALADEMRKQTTIDAIFKRKEPSTSNNSVYSAQTSSQIDSHEIEATILEPPPPNVNTTEVDISIRVHHHSKIPHIESTGEDTSYKIVRDPGLRHSIWDFSSEKQDEIRRAYLMAGPYQPILNVYPSSGPENHRRRFQASWFKLFHWLEYSTDKDSAYCLPCYLFTRPDGRPGSDVFITRGFDKWKKVNDGKNCAFLGHKGKDHNSQHNKAEKACLDLMNQAYHIQNVFKRQSTQEVLHNRLRLKTSVDVIRWLTFQACPFRGHDESLSSQNRGNFLEMVKLLASYNEQVSGVVLGNAPQNAKYTSPDIQKEILHVIANKVRHTIRSEIGEAKFCIIVDEARDESKREQMAIVLRFVDKKGFVQERFFYLVHVRDTSALTLKTDISKVLSNHNLNVKDIRGQGYDGASNMRGEWNGLQALFLQECPYAYYVHCLAHRLQLALVAASREVIPIHQFFSNLTFIINVVGASCKRRDELQAYHAAEIAQLVAAQELESGRGLNQMTTLKRAGDTRWGSHLNSISSLIRMFNSVRSVLSDITIGGSTYAQRGDVDAAYNMVSSFDFIFILHLMKEILQTTGDLCQALQYKSQDILNAMSLVSTTKKLIQKMREDGWNSFFGQVLSFCRKNEISIPDMSSNYPGSRGRSRRQKDPLTVEHHYRIEVFLAGLDSQLQELNTRFSDHTMDLLILSAALDPQDRYKSFNINNICELVDKFYPDDFTEQEKYHLKYELQHYELDVPYHVDLQEVKTIGELCQKLVETGESNNLSSFDRLLRFY